MVRLFLLGSADLRDDRNCVVLDVLSQPKRLALLAYIAVASRERPVRRDRLLALFWPESDQQHARASLRRAVYELRHRLGPEVFVYRNEQEIAINPDALWCDVSACQQALADGRVQDAFDVYRGDMLPSFFVSGMAGFEEWLEQERSALRAHATRAVMGEARMAAERGDTAVALTWARVSFRLDEYNEDALRLLMRLSSDAGDRTTAIQVYEQFVARAKRELEVEPSAETVRLATTIRADRRAHLTDEPAIIATRPQRPTRTRRLRPRWAVAGAVAFFLGGAVWVRVANGDHMSRPAIVVLPFRHAGGDSVAQYAIDGVEDALTDELGRVSTLRTISRTSALHYEGSKRTAVDIAREIGANTVIEGAALVKGDSLRVHVRIVAVTPEQLAWTRAYQRNLADVSTLPQVMAADILEQLGVSLTAHERARLTRLPWSKPDAYEYYLRGLFHTRVWLPADMARGRELLRTAIRLEPENPLPYVALAQNCADAALGHGGVPARDMVTCATTAAERALALDEESSDAHAVLGKVKLYFQWDWKGAEREFRRAIAINPSDADAQWGYSLYLLCAGRVDDAIAANHRAQELDPLSPIINSDLGKAYVYAGQFEAAERWAQRSLELENDFPAALWVFGEARFGMGRRAEAVALDARAAARNPYMFRPILAHMLARTGASDSARAILTAIPDSTKRELAYHVAQAYVALGDRDQAFRWLEIAYGQRNAWLRQIWSSPYFRDVRSDPRFQDLARRMNFSELR